MDTENSSRIVRVVVVVLIALLLISTFSKAARQIDAGTVGVVKRWGRVTGRVLDPGLNWVMPYVDTVVVYNTKDIIYETAPVDKQIGSRADYVDYPVDTTTEDGQQVELAYSIRFRVERSQAPTVAQELGDEQDVVEKVVKFHSRILCRQVPRNYKASDLYTGDVTAVEEDIASQLRPLFATKGLFLDSFGIREIGFSPDYVQAIEQKQIEKERVTTEQYKAEQAEKRKQASITEAEGEAEAISIKGAALRENPNMIQLEFVRALRDPASTVKVMIIPGEGLLPIFDLSSVDVLD